MTAPLLSLRDVRIDEDGSPVLERLSCEATRDRVVLVGHWTGLFKALVRSARVTNGVARILGRDFDGAVASGAVGVALHSPRLPPDFTVIEYLTRSAELLGGPVRAARRMAHGALARTGLEAFTKRTFATLAEPERRCVLIAGALLGTPGALALDRPLARLDEEPASFVRAVLERAAAGLRVLVSVDSPVTEGPERRLLDTADEALVLYPDGSVARLDPKVPARPGRRYVVVVGAASGALAEALSARGVEIEAALPTDGESRLVLRLPDGETTDVILRTAVDLSVPIFGMTPLDSASAVSAPVDVA